MRETPPFKVIFVTAYVCLAAVDFLHFLYSRRLSSGLSICAFVFLAVGWNWWFDRLAKENRVTRLNLGATESNHGQR
jgi:hypothetical protein